MAGPPGSCGCGASRGACARVARPGQAGVAPAGSGVRGSRMRGFAIARRVPQGGLLREAPARAGPHAAVPAGRDRKGLKSPAARQGRGGSCSPSHLRVQPQSVAFSADVPGLFRLPYGPLRGGGVACIHAFAACMSSCSADRRHHPSVGKVIRQFCRQGNSQDAHQAWRRGQQRDL